MPELPEVETMARGLQPIVGGRILKVRKPRCPCRPIVIEPSVSTIRRKIEGRIVSQVTRLGKRVVIHVDDQRLFFQPKMTGLVSTDGVPDPGHLRFELLVEQKGQRPIQVLFWDRRGLGTVTLLDESQVQKKMITGKLGPDALEITYEDFRARLLATRRPIKVALLDQKLVAGVGNLYASEMLFAAKIAPTDSAASISARKMRRLYTAMLDILNTAIEYEGSTLSDGTYRNAVNDPGSYQNEHRVYDRAGQPCPRCPCLIERIVQAQRSTFYCPRCQK